MISRESEGGKIAPAAGTCVVEAGGTDARVLTVKLGVLRAVVGCRWFHLRKKGNESSFVF